MLFEGENGVEVVKELERQKSLGRIRYYGVSNFGRRNLESFMEAGGKPITNQVIFPALYSRRCAFSLIFCGVNIQQPSQGSCVFIKSKFHNLVHIIMPLYFLKLQIFIHKKDGYPLNSGFYYPI